MKNKKVIIGVVVCLVIAAVSFKGGMMYGQSKNVSFSSNRTGQFGQGSMNQNGVNKNFGMRNGGGFGGVVSGEVLSKDATSMTVKLRDGGSKIVLMSPSVKVEKTVEGAASDVEVGKSIMVTGASNPDGSVSATSVQIRPNFPVPPVKTN